MSPSSAGACISSEAMRVTRPPPALRTECRAELRPDGAIALPDAEGGASRALRVGVFSPLVSARKLSQPSVTVRCSRAVIEA